MNQVYEKLLLEAYRLMLAAFGPCNWWPGNTPWEVMVGAILTQNTAWSNVEKAITNLKTHNMLAVLKMAATPIEQLAQSIRPSGYYKQKAKKLKALVSFFEGEYGCDIDKMRKDELPILRDKLLGVHGIGPETADSILLYALDKPIFVVDAYTKRIFNRHGIIPESYNYHQIQEFFETHIAADVAHYNEYHALIVYTGKEFCRPKPRCSGCPLEGFNIG